MYSVQNRIYCSVCKNSFTASNYPNHLKSQGLVNIMFRKTIAPIKR